MDFYLSRSLSRWNWSTPLHPLLPIAGMIPPLPTCAKIPSLPSVVVGRSSIDLLSTFNMWWELHLHDFLYGLPSRSPMSSLSIAVVVEVFDLTGDMHLTPSVRTETSWDEIVNRRWKCRPSLVWSSPATGRIFDGGSAPTFPQFPTR